MTHTENIELIKAIAYKCIDASSLGKTGEIETISTLVSCSPVNERDSFYICVTFFAKQEAITTHSNRSIFMYHWQAKEAIQFIGEKLIALISQPTISMAEVIELEVEMLKKK